MRLEKIVWLKECEEAFQELKFMLIKKPILTVMDPAKKFILQTDASEQGLGAVLSQVGEDSQESPVAYAS